MSFYLFFLSPSSLSCSLSFPPLQVSLSKPIYLFPVCGGFPLLGLPRPGIPLQLCFKTLSRCKEKDLSRCASANCTTPPCLGSTLTGRVRVPPWVGPVPPSAPGTGCSPGPAGPRFRGGNTAEGGEKSLSPPCYEGSLQIPKEKRMIL